MLSNPAKYFLKKKTSLKFKMKFKFYRLEFDLMLKIVDDDKTHKRENKHQKQVENQKIEHVLDRFDDSFEGASHFLREKYCDR